MGLEQVLKERVRRGSRKYKKRQKELKTIAKKVQKEVKEERSLSQSSWVIDYKGPLVSINKYKSLHWRKLKKEIDLVKKEIGSLLKEQPIPVLKHIKLLVLSNTRHDLDNHVGTLKVVVDELVNTGVIEDDSPKYLSEITFRYDESLPFKGLRIEIFK